MGSVRTAVGLILSILGFDQALVHAETLREVLQKNDIPISQFTKADLETQVSSGDAEMVGGLRLLAYPSFDGKESLRFPLHVVSYDSATQKVMYQRLSSPEIPDICGGSVLGLHQQGESFLVETHINPSAGCTIVLDSKLHVRRTLMGGRIAQLGRNEILMFENQIHFAEAHPLRLRVLNLITGQSQEIYPPDRDLLRAQFARDLTKHLPSEQWCRENNRSCDPQFFEEEVQSSVSANPVGTRIGLIVTHGAYPLGEEAKREIGHRSVLYVYRRQSKGWTYCQGELDDTEINPMRERLAIDLEGAMKLCTAQHKVFVKPVDSPFSKIK